jgi:predicted translin family RNA/ssDNA-binding protein
MDINRYNTRIRQAVSDKYVECSKRHQEIAHELQELRRKLKSFMDGEEQLTYQEYVDVKSAIDFLNREDDELYIKIAVWDEAREICLNIADEMCE